MSGNLALEPAPDLLVGRVLQERYRVLRKLGEGGMGAVYEGEHLLIKKRVAIKVLHPQFAAAGEMVARFQQEALAATAIGHEHIVEVNDLGRTAEGGIFMVLELLSGHDFASLVEAEAPLPIGRVAHIVMQVCAGVQAAHDKGIIHRDLKPENIFLVRRAEDPDFVKVLDFGISKIMNAEISDGARASTKTGSVIGTAYYMSPEQAQGRKNLDHRTDVWAIGVILFRALTAAYPFDDESYPMLIVKLCTETPPSVRTLRPDVPEELAAIVSRCLTRDVNMRVRSCAELRELLRPFESFVSAPRDPFATTALAGTTGPARAISTGSAASVVAAAHARTGLATGPMEAARSVTPFASSSTPPPAPPPRAWRWRRALGGVVVVGLAVGVTALVASGVLGGGAASTPLPPPSPPAPSTVSSLPPSSVVSAPPTSVVATVSPRRRVAFDVSPAGVAVEVNGVHVCDAPCSSELDDVPSTFAFVLEGHQREERAFASPLPERIQLQLQPEAERTRRPPRPHSGPSGGGEPVIQLRER